MTVFRRPAIKTMQGKYRLFLTAFTLRDFMTDNFYRVKKADVKGSTGFQRGLMTKRVQEMSEDILAAAAVKTGSEVFLPTSVFLATGGNVDYDEETKKLFFDSDPLGDICPLDVVDGQHRIIGMLMAAEENESLLDFPIPTVIVDNMGEVDRMLHFVIINTKQRTVDKGIEQHIIAGFHRKLGIEDLPYFPSWLDKLVRKDGDERALRIVKELNSNERSPWHGRIQLADEVNDPTRHTVRQASFVQSIKKYLIPESHPLNKLPSANRIDILINFWIAIDKILVDAPDATPVVFKEMALEFFHRISITVIDELRRRQSVDPGYMAGKIEECIRSARDFLLPADEEILSPKFWESGGSAGQQNRSGMARLATVFSEALIRANEEDTEI